MSSVVSLRSYQKRRKSAGARLEGAYSQLQDYLYYDPPFSALPPEQQRQMRQQMQQQMQQQMEQQQMPTIRVANYKEKRVKSARETRKEQEASAIFPELQKDKMDPEWGKTKYSEDFGLKVASPVHIRPVSPTRMNNPHPSKEFMQWKHPTRIHEHKKATNPPPDIWRYINERFYEDYWDTYNTGDARNEVPITNLAKIGFPGKKKEKTGSKTISGISGKKAPLNSRHFPQVKNGEMNSDGDPQAILRPPSPQSLMIQQTIKGTSLPVFREWLKTATSKEREILLTMLQAAHDDSEETRLNKAVNDVLQSESAEKVQEWLKDVSPSERQMVLHVLETLAVATGEEDVCALTYPALYPRLQHRHHRHRTFPLSLQGQGGPQHYQHHHPHSSSSSSSSSSSRHHHHHHHHHHRHHSHSKSKHSSAASAKSSLDSASQMGLVGKKIARPGKEYYDEHPEIWQNRILRKKLGTDKVHPAGVFNQPQRDIGQHFTIHPEWPTA